ncbi:hypothetical protein PybrP1_007668 [[Pythium] brassicae (nom. inval.)]|nr:hypothetical protein PybrP1_007668 [[Pythium] brassicae (nom. inval.)]
MLQSWSTPSRKAAVGSICQSRSRLASCSQLPVSSGCQQPVAACSQLPVTSCLKWLPPELSVTAILQTARARVVFPVGVPSRCFCVATLVVPQTVAPIANPPQAPRCQPVLLHCLRTLPSCYQPLPPWRKPKLTPCRKPSPSIAQTAHDRVVHELTARRATSRKPLGCRVTSGKRAKNGVRAHDVVTPRMTAT